MEKQIQKWIEQMTLEEKCRLLTGNRALETAPNERLGIPHIEMSDGPHGIRRLIGHDKFPQECNISGGDTCFPTASAVASSWNREIAEKAGKHIAIDCHEEGIDLLLAPAINMKRTPLCGRNFEYFSEDPLLAGEMAASFINGVQNEGVGTSLKHFAANNQELNRGSISVEVDEQTLREYYLEAFRIAIEKGNPETVMCAYNKLGGIWCSENKWLLTELLKNEWKYDGLVMSDWWAVHDSAKAIAAGIELEMPCNEDIYSVVLDGIKKGIVSEKIINEHCSKVLSLIMHRISKRKQNVSYDRKEQHKAAYEAASECITLLKNEKNVLPVNAEKQIGIAVFGSMAAEPVIMGGGSSCVTVEDIFVDKPIDFIKGYCDGKTNLYYEPLYTDGIGVYSKCERIKMLSEKADLAIVFAGSEMCHEIEGEDRKRITFPEMVNDLIDNICNEFKSVVVVMQTGCCTVGSDWINKADGIIQMWLCGEGGGKAIADILFGTVNPSGKLSETFIKKLPEHLQNISKDNSIRYSEGLNCGYRYYDKHPDEVWYPFGHGLSYTTFEYGDLNIEPQNSNDPDSIVNVSLTVKNTGKLFGKEVVQVYVGPQNSMTARPIKELCDFAKIELNPGESKTLKFKLSSRAFSYYNVYLHEWHVESGKYNIYIGTSSADIRLSGIYSVNYAKDYTVDLVNQAGIL